MEDVRKLPGLVRRKAVYYYRRRVPLDVRVAFGKSEVVVSLGTTERKVAAEAWYDLDAKWEDEFNRLRAPEAELLTGPERFLRTRTGRLRAIRRAKGNHAGLRSLDAATALRLARVWFNLENERRKVTPLSEDEDEDEDEDEAIVESSQDEYLFERHASSSLAQQRIQSTADLLLEDKAYGGFPGEEAYDLLCYYLRRAMLALARCDLARLRGDFSKEGYDHLFPNEVEASSQGGPLTQGVVSGVTVKEARERFQAEEIDSRDGLAVRTRAKLRTGLDLAVEFFGKDTSLASIDTPQCKAYEKFLKQLPPNFTKRRHGQTLKALAEAAEKQGLSGLKSATRESYLAPLRQMFEWAMGERMIMDNPFRHVLKRGTKIDDEAKRHSFTSEQLRQMFNASLYRGCVDDDRGFNTPGPQHPRRGRFWLPLLGLYTGARLGELCQLRVDDVKRSEGGTPFIRIHADEKGMSLKTKNSQRSFPLHPELGRIGFMQFVAQQREAGQVHLFPEVLVDGRSPGYRSSKLFTNFRKAVGVNSDGVCFHSFRHTFRDALRNAGIDREIAEVLGGWSNDNRTSSRYGEGYAIEALSESIAKVKYEGLDLSHLHVSD